MKAENIPADKIVKRNKLAESVPLNTPYSILISTGNVCNFRCIYCEAFKKGDSAAFGHGTPSLMPLDTFITIADQLAEFDEPLRQITFAGMGEPILNKNLPDMIRIIKERNIALSARVISNGSILTHDLSDKLIEAGLDYLTISLQGLSAKKYYEVCGVEIDFEKFIEQITYFYRNKRNCKLYVKIIDIALERDEEDDFYHLFGNYCDYIYIEKCSRECAIDNNYFTNKFGNNVADLKICPKPFFKFLIEHNGDIKICCTKPVDTLLSNIYQKSIKKTWHEDFMELQLNLLQNTLPVESTCNKCKSFQTTSSLDDCLDGYEGEIMKRYMKEDAT